MVKALPVHGADISHHQSNIDLARAKREGLDWVFHKATQGLTFTDDKYLVRRDFARAVDLPFGAYHFAETKGTPEDQIARFVKFAGLKPGDMRPMLDVEDYADGNSFFSKMSIGDRTAFVGRFVKALKNSFGVNPFIYTPFDLLDNFDCPLWVARYHNENAAPRVPKPWSTYTIRQFSDGIFGVPNSFPGLGHVDLNCWNGNPDVLLGVFRLPEQNASPEEPKPVSTDRGLEVESAIGHLKKARGKGERGALIKDALADLIAIEPIGTMGAAKRMAKIDSALTKLKQIGKIS